MKPLRLARVASCAVVLIATGLAHAEGSSSERALASRLFDEAGRLMAAGKFAEACPKYAESQRLDPELGTLLHLAECDASAGMTATAWTNFREAADLAAQRKDPREHKIRERIAKLEKNLSNLIIVVSPNEPAGLEIRQDGALVGKAAWGTPIPIDPGAHTIDATAPGFEPRELSTTVGDKGATVTVTLPVPVAKPAEPVAAAVSAPATTAPLAATAPAPSDDRHPSWLSTHQRSAAAVVGGVGVVGVGLGTYFGLQSKSKHDDAAKLCGSTSCTNAAGVSAGNDARSAGNLSTVMMIVGGVGLAAGVTLWVTAPKTESTQVGIGPGSVQLKAVW